jgi:hypothetical protein
MAVGEVAEWFVDWRINGGIRDEKELGFDLPYSHSRRTRATLDWHHPRSKSEPPCGANQWRTKDRSVVLNMCDMSDRHLGHCIRFATENPHHASKIAALLAERERREALSPKP